MNRPLIGTGRAEAIVGQIGVLTDAHTRVADHQKGVATQIVAVDELLPKELILLGRERAWESLREVRDVLATDQVRELRKRFSPTQFGEDGAQIDEQVDIGLGREGRRLRAQAGHPAEEMGLTAQLVQGVHLGVIGAEMTQKVADGPAVMTSGVGTERSAEGIDSALEDRSQTMGERGAVVWSNDYFKVVRAYYVIDECAAKMGVPINLLKPKGISRLSRSGRSEEIATKASIDYLGYEISLERISIKEKRISKIKCRASYLIYQNLLQPLKRNIFNLPRIAGPIDLDYLTAVRQVRSYLYGGLPDDKLRSYLAGRTPELHFRGLMSYYPVVNDIEQLRKLDGWMDHTFRQALRARERLWRANANISLPGPEPNWNERIDSLQTCTVASGETVDLRLPSFALINRAMRLAISRRGLNAVANPAARYHIE
ncbi:MAG: hypothetical protein ACRD2P_01470 [Terriglobia bacterium]